jgi:glycerol-3-phosphate dehydrogenase (NAD(P)+)
VPLPETLRFTPSIEELATANLVLLVTPSKAIREAGERLAKLPLAPGAFLLSCTKGVERVSGLRMSEVLAELFPGHPVAVLSGPSHAEELARRSPTAVVVGSAQPEIAIALQRAFSTKYLRAYTSEDVAGIELGGALKNIYAIDAGVSDGLGLGDNAKASLVTRALAELIRLGAALGGRRETFYGLSGVGDLMVTCFSQHSRNRAVGERLGHGESASAILESMQMVAEGVPTTYSAWECAQKFGVETPIIAQMHAVLEGQVSARGALSLLLSRDPKPEAS